MGPITGVAAGLVVGVAAGWIARGSVGPRRPPSDQGRQRALERGDQGRRGRSAPRQQRSASRHGRRKLQEDDGGGKGGTRPEAPAVRGAGEAPVERLREAEPADRAAGGAGAVGETAKLSDNRQVGQWGEIQLRRVVELARMAKHCDFVEQPTSEGSRGRPDMVMKLPNGRAVVVDAKASTAAFLEARTTSDDTAAKDALDRHAKGPKRQTLSPRRTTEPA